MFGWGKRGGGGGGSGGGKEVENVVWIGNKSDGI